MKKLITTMALIATTIAITAMPAEAALKSNTLKTTTSVPTLAILDTALDTSIKSINSRVVAEVCILDWASCPNGKTFMEGPGSSVLPMNFLATNSFNHGTQMASAAIAANPNINIVFIRIVGNTTKGAQQTYGLNTLVNALTWVNNNKAKYNIVAVASSHATNAPVVKKAAGTNYCLPTEVDSVISTLNNSGVPVFFPSGNSAGDVNMKGKIEWPACISQSIAVGGVETLNLDKPQVSLVSNYDSNLVDLWGEIQQPTIYPGNVNGYSYGTSVSVQVVAAKYVYLKSLKPTLTSTQLISLMKTASDPVENSYGQKVYLFNLSKVING
jgi:hypothetical protein